MTAPEIRFTVDHSRLRAAILRAVAATRQFNAALSKGRQWDPSSWWRRG